MIKYKLIVVGKIKENYFVAAIEEYLKRMSNYAKIQIEEIPDEKDSNLSVEIESKKILSKLNNKSYNILLDIKGEIITSEMFAEKLSKLTLNYSEICFIIGGSNGVSETLKTKVNYKLSFSKMTFTHIMARVILVEQIYRAICINNNIKYHK